MLKDTIIYVQIFSFSKKMENPLVFGPLTVYNPFNCEAPICVEKSKDIH